VLSERREPFDGEGEPSVGVALEWPAAGARAVDAFGDPQPARVGAGELRLELTDTPVFVTVA
jgi:hypothetical protein